MIRKAELYRTVYDPGKIANTGLTEVVVAGRSNAGKSSLINKLCNNAKLARVSSKPGKTRSINYYLINDKLFLVDLPGYGFAKRSGAEQQAWKALVESYFEASRQNIKLLLLLCDIRHGATQEDIILSEYLRYYGLPYILVATKCDKVSKSRRNTLTIKLEAQLSAEKTVCFSALDGTGKDELSSLITGIADK